MIQEVLAAIRDWVKQYVAEHAGGSDSRVDGILEKIPTAASSTNQLADKSFVNSSVQTATANFRGAWENFGSIPTDVSLYPTDYAGSKTPTTNDYLVVHNASDIPLAEMSYEGTISLKNISSPNGDVVLKIGGESELVFPIIQNSATPIVISYNGLDLFTIQWMARKSTIVTIVPIKLNGVVYAAGVTIPDVFDIYGVTTRTIAFAAPLSGTWRMKYSGNWYTDGKNGWLPEYQVNEEPLTSDQVLALNSGITAELVDKLRNL